jgi:glycosyltransferase involved in cell wall biosynthesis
MKILFLITTLEVGGAEKQLIDIINNIHNSNIMIVVMKGNIIFKPIANIKIINLNIDYNVFSVFRSMREFVSVLKNFRPNIVHSHMIHANIFARICRIFYKFPYLICSSHNTYEGGLFLTTIYRLTDYLSDFNTNVSNEAVDQFYKARAVKRGRMAHVSNGIDTDEFIFNSSCRVDIRNNLNIKKNTKVFIFVGRLTEAKDPFNLLESFSIACETEENILLLIIGAGHLKDQLVTYVEKNNLIGRVIFLGLSDNISGFLSAADCFILPSAWEGFGLVVAEALACNRFVIATDSGGVKEVLGNYGILVPPRDSRKLSNAILDFLTLDTDTLESIGARGRSHIVQNYQIKLTVDKWMSIYQKKIRL